MGGEGRRDGWREGGKWSCCGMPVVKRWKEYSAGGWGMGGMRKEVK